MMELHSTTPQPIESSRQPESVRPLDSVRAILHPNFVDHPDKEPTGVAWPKIKPGEKTKADEMYKKISGTVDGNNISLYSYLDDTEGVFNSLVECLSPEQILKIGDINSINFSSSEVRLKIIQGIVEQIDTKGIDGFSAVVKKMGDIRSTDALQVLQALGVSYANDMISIAAEPQSENTTAETTLRKARRHITRTDHGRLQMPSQFTRTLKSGEDKKTLELSKKTNGLFRTVEGSPTREFQRPVEVDLRMAVALQNILLPSSERLARIQLEEQIATKKAARAPKETTTEEGNKLNRVLKKLISDEDAVAEIDVLTQQLEQMRQKERSAILVGLKIGQEDGKLAVQPPVDPDVQRLANEIQGRMPAILGGKTLETNKNQTITMLESNLTGPLSDTQKLVLQHYLSGESIHTRIPAENILKDLGLENSPQKDMIMRVLADGRSVTKAFGSLAKKQDGYSQVDDIYTRGTMFDMGLKGVEYLYRHGDIKSEVILEDTSLPPEITIGAPPPPPSELIRADIPEYIDEEISVAQIDKNLSVAPEPVDRPSLDEELQPEIKSLENKPPHPDEVLKNPSEEDVAFVDKLLQQRKTERESPADTSGAVQELPDGLQELLERDREEAKKNPLESSSSQVVVPEKEEEPVALENVEQKKEISIGKGETRTFGENVGDIYAKEATIKVKRNKVEDDIKSPTQITWGRMEVYDSDLEIEVNEGHVHAERGTRAQIGENDRHVTAEGGSHLMVGENKSTIFVIDDSYATVKENKGDVIAYDKSHVFVQSQLEPGHVVIFPNRNVFVIFPKGGAEGNTVFVSDDKNIGDSEKKATRDKTIYTLPFTPPVASLLNGNTLNEGKIKEEGGEVNIKDGTVVFPAINGNGDTVRVFFEIQQTVNGKGELSPTLVMTKVENKI